MTNHRYAQRRLVKKVVDLTAKIKATVGAVLKEDSLEERDTEESGKTKVVDGPVN